MNKRTPTEKKGLVFILIFCIILPYMAFFGSQTEAMAAEYGYCSAQELYVRSGPGTDYENVMVNGQKVVITYGKKIELVSQENGWYYIRTTFRDTKVEGFSIGTYIKTQKEWDALNSGNGSVTPTPTKVPETKEPTITPEPPGFISPKVIFEYPAEITARKIRLRKSASISSDSLGTLKRGTKVTVLNTAVKKNQRWYLVAVNSNGKTKTGYLLSDYVVFDLTSSIKAKTKVSGVTIRKAAGGNKTVKDAQGKTITLGKSNSVKILSEATKNSIKWFQVSFTLNKKTVKGYLRADQIKFDVILSGDSVQEPVPEKPTPTITPIPPQDHGTLVGSNATIQGAKALAVKAEADYSGNAVNNSSGRPVLLCENQEIEVKSGKIVDDITWYYIRFQYEDQEYYGYINASYAIPKKNVELPKPDGKGTGGSKLSFEEKLKQEGFPESYKESLRRLHERYPNWEFEAYQTGLDWEGVLQSESDPGKNLLYNTRGVEWKSLEAGAYDWKTDKFVVYDGTLWVTASKEALAYYMDPRNFLEADSIFQFELLSYKPIYQTENGINNILSNSAMYQASYDFTDGVFKKQSISYAHTFLMAAEYTGVSPFHLASRVKQEIATSSSTLSNSVSGTVAGFEGLYNFFNIGAFHSTSTGGAIANGLNYAKNGGSNTALNQACLIPWNNRFRSILGGAYYIGNNYINLGQNTIYLQKYNVTPTNTFAHQYMSNAEAPYSEGKKVYTAYQGMEDTPIVFSIPIYNNMPKQASPVPKKAYNPNNWLKTLVLNDINNNKLSLTPTFNTSMEQEYNLIVGNAIDQVTVKATAVSTKASIEGNGIMMLEPGDNELIVKVTAENGDIRAYRVNIIRETT